MGTGSQPGVAKPNASWVAWDGSNPAASLSNLYAATVAKARDQIEWYRMKVRPKRVGSQLCRLAAIVLLGLAALIPLLKAALSTAGIVPAGRMNIAFELGYVFAAIAAGVIAFDKYFGLSTGWIRYIQTQLALEGGLDELQYDWVALVARIQGQNPATEQCQAMIQRLRSFIVLVNSKTQQETEEWVMEFQANLADLEKAAKARVQEQKPGRVEVTVTNVEALTPV